MPEGRLKSRTLARIYRRTTKKGVVIHYKKRKPKLARCGGCGAVLKGVPRERPFKMQKMAKTKKRPERPYGGVLCSKCTRALIIKKARKIS